MAKKKTQHTPSKVANEDKAATLKDIMSPEIVKKLKEQAEQMKAEEEKRKADERKKAEEARTAEQKRLENDFEHLLQNSSMDWRKYK